MHTLPEQLRQGSLSAVTSLLDELPDVLFWVKDRDLRILALNQTFADRVNLPKADIIGKTDAELYFPEMARVFMGDDRKVMRTGVAIHRRVELLANRFGGVEWRSTTKLPVFDENDTVIGTTGISRPLHGATDQLPPPYRAISELIEYCREHLSEGIDVEHMATQAGMSVATLARRFRQHLNLSPGEFLSQLRSSHACKLLTDSPFNISEIAHQCGYESPAAFSRAFQKQIRLSPSAYRKSTRSPET